MIIACTKPTDEIPKNTDRSNSSLSLERSERCSSVPCLSRIERLLETDTPRNKVKAELFCRQPSAPFSFHVYNEEELLPKEKKDTIIQRSFLKKQSVKEKENKINANKMNKSNSSVKSFRKNYVLKSDVCKVTKSNFYPPSQEINPWLNYYKDIVNQRKNENNYSNDYYSLFLKNSEKEIKNTIDFNTSNYFEKNPENKREIMINRYTKNNEMVDYENNNNYYDDLEDETVSVEVPLVLNNNNMIKCSSSQNDSFSSDTLNESNKTQKQQIPNQQKSLVKPQITIQPQQPSSVYQNQFETKMKDNKTLTNTVECQNQMMNNNPIQSNYPLINQYYQKKPMTNSSFQNFNYPNMMPFINPQQNANYSNFQQYKPNIPYNQYMYPNNNYPESPMNNDIQMHKKSANNNIRHIMKNGSGNYQNYSDESLAQLAPFLVKEQGGCRYVQEKVISDPHFGNNILFPYIKNHINELICDAFGNYLFQVLVDVLTFENISMLLKLMSPSFYQICISPHGTRVVQKIIDKVAINIPLVLTFKEMLSYYLMDMCKDAYGNHIVQKYLSVIHHPNNQFIYNFISPNFLEIANTKHGCCVIQKCISEGNNDQRNQLFLIIQHNLHELITDQYGNYTIQYLFSSEDNVNTKQIINSVLDNLLYLCKLKYSSNVLEKCFENTNTEIQMMIINELTRNENIIAELVSDTYGNYVIQKALLVCKNDNYLKILSIIANNMNKIKKQPFGGKLISKLLSTHKELSNIISNGKKGKQNHTKENEINHPDESLYINYNYNDSKRMNNRTNNQNWYNNKGKRKLKEKK